MAFQNLEVVHVVAMDQQRCIGKGNALPWHISADLKHFMQDIKYWLSEREEYVKSKIVMMYIE